MNKISILLIALMVISVGFLSGCNEQNGNNNETTDGNDDDNETNGDNGENNESITVSGDIDKVEVLGYTIMTQYIDENYFLVYGSGFYPECCESIEEDDVVEYRVEVIIRNIAIETLDSVVVIAEFVDIDNNVVAREDGEQRNIPSGMNTQLGISVSSSHVNFWEISGVKFIIDAN